MMMSVRTARVARAQVNRRLSTATTTAGRSTDKVPAAGQAEGGHPNVMPKGGSGENVATKGKGRGYGPLAVIMAGVVGVAAYQLGFSEPSKEANKFQFNPETAKASAEEAAAETSQHRLQRDDSVMRSKGPFKGKNKEILGITPSDEKLENEATTHSAAGTIASAAHREGKSVDH
ncbi:Hypothetical Protein FCC1311_106322 [Hondaea fermentalgiana]|uniref:Uncharacterized protein n=1 Tax=Hondaea fermentalgiana TaxID=2315210 RepID=A0A2R5GXA0_9STRA|nr:Hypothetical Protein FCC1311_106322 [Hondaea fermentalgiana]|eukprot:GBG34408.1 Hypothetical Protein FCC1311_106322 [Hondaea fermentalgiana]